MQSEARKETSKSAVQARAKVLVSANLGWLEGFPLEAEGESVRWMAVPASAPAHEVRIERHHLSRATYALNKLRGELAPALPRFAADPAVWLDSVERRLELLKGSIHKGAPLPSRFFEEPSLPRVYREEASRLAAHEPGLLPVLNAVSWIHAGHAARAREALEPLLAWGLSFEPLVLRLGELPALVLFLRLLQLAASHGQERVQVLAGCLLDERVHDAALGQGTEFCAQILRGIGKRAKDPLPDELPTGCLGGSLAAWCEELVQQSRRSQRQDLCLFEVATPLPLVESWALWWQTTRRLLREAHELRAQRYDRESRHGLRAQVEQHQQAVPPPLDVEDLLAALRQHTTAAVPGLTAQLVRALALIPEDSTVRPHFCIYWTFLGQYSDAPTSRIAALLAGFEVYLSRRRGPASAWLWPWSDVVWKPHQPLYLDCIEDDLLESERPRRTILEVYDHLASMAVSSGDEGLPPHTASRAVELFLLAGDSDLAARFFASMQARGDLRNHLSQEAGKLAVRFCRDRPERFADVLAALAPQEDDGGLPPSEWPELLLSPLSSGELGDFVREAIVSRQLARLHVCAMKSVLLAAAGAGPLPRPDLGEAAAPGWVRRYPPELHTALDRLAAVLPDAEPRVARWLADDAPDRQRLEREIEAITLRIDQVDAERQAALRTRLANLKARLAQPAALRPARIERLRARLDRAWGRAVLDRWEREIDSLLPEALRRLLGIEKVPAWLMETRHLSLLAAASRLRGDAQRLAYRLFRLRCGPPPWDLRDAPPNRSFVESLPHLDWHPWIECLGTVTVEAAGGKRLHLALEDDPLEIFRMGAHFKTCLSPGCMNYFSVFSNAADINKRVLYARDDGGKIVGRCLLALTAPGEMLMFEPYCHDRDLELATLCADFADQLARRMGTRRAERGRVPTLVASRWYDDGPRDLGRQYPCLEEGSPLRRRLATLRPGELVDELRRSLKPAGLDESTLPLVLELPELRQRPELAAPLLRRVAECHALPDWVLVNAAHLGEQAGSIDLLRRHLLRPLMDFLRRVYRAGGNPELRTVELVGRLDPAGLLSLLRQTRRAPVRDWSDEIHGNRLESAAKALEALFRPRQAQVLWQRLASSNAVYAEEDQRQRARAALARLSQPEA